MVLWFSFFFASVKTMMCGGKLKHKISAFRMILALMMGAFSLGNWQ